MSMNSHSLNKWLYLLKQKDSNPFFLYPTRDFFSILFYEPFAPQAGFLPRSKRLQIYNLFLSWQEIFFVFLKLVFKTSQKKTGPQIYNLCALSSKTKTKSFNELFSLFQLLAAKPSLLSGCKYTTLFRFNKFFMAFSVVFLGMLGSWFLVNWESIAGEDFWMKLLFLPSYFPANPALGIVVVAPDPFRDYKRKARLPKAIAVAGMP